VVITDFLQAAILLPFTLILAVTALVRVGGFHGLLQSLPADMTSLRLPGEFGWTYVAAWVLMVSFGYNTSAMAQRYFSVDDERSARRVALLCFTLFLFGAFFWFIPPMAMRVLHPDLHVVFPDLANPHESSYALAARTLLPSGLVGIMLAAMFSSTMASLSGLLNLHAAIVAKDIYPTLFPKKAGSTERLVVGWVATFAVGAGIVMIALLMAQTRRSVFQVMLTVNTIMSLAYGPPALLGLVVRRTPSWSGLASFVVSLALGLYGTFALGWGLVTSVAVIVPAAAAVFLLSCLLPEKDEARIRARDGLFLRLDTPIDVGREVGAGHDPTHEVFRFLGRAITIVALVSLVALFTAAPGERVVVLGYVAITLALAVGLAFIPGARPVASPAPAATP
jgi:SSS family solute:Na+ symporter